MGSRKRFEGWPKMCLNASVVCCFSVAAMPCSWSVRRIQTPGALYGKFHTLSVHDIWKFSVLPGGPSLCDQGPTAASGSDHPILRNFDPTRPPHLSLYYSYFNRCPDASPASVSGAAGGQTMHSLKPHVAAAEHCFPTTPSRTFVLLEPGCLCTGQVVKAPASASTT